MVKVGDSIPTVELTEGNPGGKVNLATELASGSGIIIGVPAAFSKFVCYPLALLDLSEALCCLQPSLSESAMLFVSFCGINTSCSYSVKGSVNNTQAQPAPTRTFQASSHTQSCPALVRSSLSPSTMLLCKNLCSLSKTSTSS